MGVHFLPQRRENSEKVGFIRKNGIFDKISGFFAIYRKGYYNKQKEQSPQDWRRTAMEEGNAKSLVRRLPIKNRITLMVILISVVPILIISIFPMPRPLFRSGRRCEPLRRRR